MERFESSSALASSKLTPPRGEYEVFLSFRGPDVRTTFADHLYQFLDNYGIRTFLDNEEIRQGEKFSPEIIKAIEESKVYIPIFSPGYASSKWCLREVAHMHKCCKQYKGHIILPIFYHVEPRDVRHQKRSYAEAFQQHNEVYDEGTLKDWKATLQEGAIVREVFSRVRSHLMGSYLLVTEQLVSIDPHVEQVTKLLNKCVKVVGIVGMGGIGKTTIAMAVRDEVYTHFDRCCFLRDVQETLLGKEGIVALQKQIMFAILGHDENIQDASQGIRLIKDRICKHKVLIIVDDADERFEFKQVLGNLEDFSSASRFIITTRNQRVLEFFEHELYFPKELDHDHSLQLFSRHAFGLDYPPEDHVALSEEFVKVATGLPLALKVIGSTLNRKSERFWEEKLEQLKKLPHTEVQQRLMISYLDLTYEEQQIFLDIACTFIGVSKEQPFYMWSDCDFYPEIGIDTLILKSLVRVDGENEFWMHDSVRDLGRAIVREEDPRRPWRRSRIWSHEDVLEVLTNKQGFGQLEGLTLNSGYGRPKITNRPFKKMSRLRYLRVFGGNFAESLAGALPNIRWLHVSCNSIPADLNMKKLVSFHMYLCSVKDDSGGWKKLKVGRNLKYLSVSHCNSLETAPDLSLCGNLELLSLEWCMKMSGELHIGNLQNLKVLHLKHTEITELTGYIEHLQNLQEIVVLGSKLRALPVGIGKLSSLEILNVMSYQRKWKEAATVPTSLKQLYLSAQGVSNLLDLKSLEVLWFTDSWQKFPGDMWKLSKLKSLHLSRFGSESILVEGEGGSEMISPSALPSSLSELHIRDCATLKRLPSLSNLCNLAELVLSKTSLRAIHGLEGLRMLETLEIFGAPDLTNLSGLECLVFLKKLRLYRCSLLEKLPGLQNLTKLNQLEISNCPLLPEVSGCTQVWEALSILTMRGCLHL
ncbi:Disease resistance protein L6 [Linum perenne]